MEFSISALKGSTKANRFITEQMGMQKEFRGLCQKRFTNVMNGQIHDREKKENVQCWE